MERPVQYPRTSQRGAAIVEFAVVLPLLLGLVLGMVDFGIILHNEQALREQNRRATRNAVVGVVQDTSCVTQVLTPGNVNADTVRLICGVKNEIGHEVRVKLTFDNFEEGESLTLCSMTPSTSLSGVLHEVVGDGASRAKHEMRIENTDYAVLNAVEEPPLEDQDWEWCS